MRGRTLGIARGLVSAALAVALIGGAGCGGGGGGPKADIRGRILLVTTGQPPNPSATVRVDGAGAVTTFADGSFTIRNASAAATLIEVTAAGMTALRQTLPPLTENAVNDLGTIFMTDTAYDASVDGTVVRSDTLAPVAGASVTISGKKTTTNASGFFSLADLPAGLGGIGIAAGLIRATGFEDKVLEFDLPLGTGMNHLGDIPISPPVGGIPGGPTTIKGKVTLQGQTVHSGTTVTLKRTSDGQVLGSVTTQDDGSYGFWVPVGQYEVRAERAGFTAQTAAAEVVRLDATITVNMTLTP
ncbi:MAG: carboxypeptidase regulatory-like domain-containing protein [Chthonomonadales bacterium]|nr:carboxypeptidase regulatory-like domain-containing protein [Chthonomonadales bacterium]